MKKPTQEDITDKLQLGPCPQVQAVDRLSDPLTDTPMRVTLEQLRPYEHNPRFIRNPLYEDIKASIRERGLDQPPPITRRPGEPHFIIRNGGNTRLAILGELWQETRDEKFFRIHCLFRPWTTEVTALLGHLAESDLHGQLTFIERALAVAKLKAMYETDGAALSQRELARRLAAGGYPVSQPHISRMFDTLEHLLPAIPHTLYAGLGKPQIERLIRLHSQAERTWNRYPPATITFIEFWLDTLASFDAGPDAFDIELVQDELLERMSRALGQSYRVLALELTDSPPGTQVSGIATDTAPASSQPANTLKHDSGTSHPAPSVDSTPSTIRPKTDHPASNVTTALTQEERQARIDAQVMTPASTTSRVQQIREQIARETFDDALPDIEACAVSDTWYIEPPLDTPPQLRAAIASLAREMAGYAGQADSVFEQADGLGFALHMEHLDLDTPRAMSIHLLLTALLRAQDEVDWDDRKQLPSALFGQLLLGIYHLPLAERPALDIGLERLPDALLIKLYRLIRLARRLIDLTLAPAPDSLEKQP
ncbi:ParB family protein [Pseudomonas sp. GWSMS-1]|uniref:ParB family protein n=1 Tax=Pseudomonas sp. GWSMS-1 TaxID=3308997 RepID=UPI003CF2CC6F